MDLMTDHLNLKPNEVAKNFSFYKRDRKSGESVNEYIAELRRLSERRKSRYISTRSVCVWANK